MSDVPEGCRMSEVGVIPEDWDVIKMGDVFEFKNGLNKEKRYFGHGTPIVNYIDVYKNNALSAKDLTGKVTVTKTELKAYEVRKDDVFFTRTSETVDEIGITSVITDKLEKTVFSGFILRARPKNNWLDTRYKKYCFSSENVRKGITSKSSYTTRALTNGRLLSEVQIPLPPIAEQQAIASALSDVGALITALEQLITKKRNIKQGAMQQLLTGEKRLPGFGGGWEVKKLGEVLKVRHGKSQKSVNNENGLYPILATGGEIGRADAFLYDKPSVLIGRKGTIDVPQYMETPFWTIDTLFFTEISDNTNPKYIFYKFNLIDWYSHNEASGVPSMNASTIEKIELLFPPTIEEQQAIAQILSDMDTEIESLEQKRNKYKAIKQGMMQELLTGKTRLV